MASHLNLVTRIDLTEKAAADLSSLRRIKSQISDELLIKQSLVIAAHIIKSAVKGKMPGIYSKKQKTNIFSKANRDVRFPFDIIRNAEEAKTSSSNPKIDAINFSLGNKSRKAVTKLKSQFGFKDDAAAVYFALDFMSEVAREIQQVEKGETKNLIVGNLVEFYKLKTGFEFKYKPSISKPSGPSF